MIELELKAAVPDPAKLVERLRSLGAHEEFSGQMIDRRLDFADNSLTIRDEVLRMRVYTDSAGQTTASVDWKGPVTIDGGYKRREEIGASTGDAETLLTILRYIGLRVTRTIDRTIRQFVVEGATVRLEHYPQMDDLVEVEGEPAAIERAIARIGIPRAEFSTDSLALFVERYTARTGNAAITGSIGESAVESRP